MYTIIDEVRIPNSSHSYIYMPELLSAGPRGSFV